MRTFTLTCPECNHSFEKQLGWKNARITKAWPSSVIYTDECPKCGEIFEIEISRDEFESIAAD
jgi:hypothetical protein